MDGHSQAGLFLLGEASPRRQMQSLFTGICINIGFVLLLGFVHSAAPSPSFAARSSKPVFLVADPVPESLVRVPVVKFRAPPLVRETSRLTAPLLEAPLTLRESLPASLRAGVAPLAIPAVAPAPFIPPPKIQPVVGVFPQAATGYSLRATAAPLAVLPVRTSAFSAASAPSSTRPGSNPAQVTDAGFAAPGRFGRVADSGQMATAIAGFGDREQAVRGKPAGAHPTTLASGFDVPRQASVIAHASGGAAPAPALKAVEILGKPRPQYTEEARNLKIEGEVWLEILFRSDATVQVRRLVRGLGHGLDENASIATTQIRFRPAEQDGRAVDEVAIIRVQFQLAN